MTTNQHSTSSYGQIVLYRLLSLRYLSDCTPLVFNTILTNGKYAALGVVAMYLIIISLWFPFWLLSFVISEWGVYLSMIGTIFLIGRMIIRLIAFPGASQKIITDIENEFAKYSIRMVDTACISIIELATIFEPRDQSGEHHLDNHAISLIPNLWRRVQSFRCRVLAVYVDVLHFMYHDATTSLELSSNLMDVAQPGDTTANGGYSSELTRYGNNRLSGDIGNVLLLPSKVRTDGRELLKRLENVIQLIHDLETVAGSLLERKSKIVTDQSRVAAGKMKDTASELRDFVSSLKGSDDAETSLGEDPNDTVRRKMEEQAKDSMFETMKVALKNVATLLDPPPHNSIFGLDVLRGCMLSRYVGSKQIWVRRPTGGMIDVVHFPATTNHRSSSTNGGGCTADGNTKKAVLYCNPNAGLIEVVTGMSITGGNVPTVDTGNAPNDSWVDFYTEQGIDVYVFNYAGYGRSYGTTLCVRGPIYHGEQYPGCLRKLYRMVRSALFAFQPTPDTVRDDGIAVAKHILLQCGVNNLYIHGESIGGIAASATARSISQSTLRSKLVLLICDRTFCNLEAIAQRLVGDWTGYAIRFLAPFWNTDVTGDFLAASCPKIVASDAADMIIAEPSSLKSGIAIWKELHRGVTTTKGIGWVPPTPLQYRMAEWENCCVNDSKHVSPTALFRAQPPVWPRDKHVSFDEAFHFAACCKRIGKLATSVARAASRDSGGLDSLDVSRQPVLVQAWAVLGSCDGLTGATLGVATKRGFDASITWLCAVLVFGGQLVARQAEKRSQQQQQGLAPALEITMSDFDIRPIENKLQDEDISSSYSRPIPVVLQMLVSFIEVPDESMVKLSHEFQFVAATLHYIQSRLSSSAIIHEAQGIRSLQAVGDSNIGVFLNLNCGHNNSFSDDEKQDLIFWLNQASNHQGDLV